MKQSRRPSSSALLGWLVGVFALISVCVPRVASAGSSVSIWNAGSGNWTDSAKWGGAPPISGDALEFTGRGGFSTNNNALTSITGIEFASGAGAYTLNGTALTIGPNGVLNLSSATQSIALAITLNGTQTLAATSGNLAVSGPITGTGGLLKIGNSTLVLTGNNSYTGGTTISNGTLQIGEGGTTGGIAGNVTLNGGPGSNLAFNRSDTRTFGGNITGNGSVLQNGNGTTVLTGTGNYSGGTAINAGTLEVSGTGKIAGGSLFTRNGTYSVRSNGTASHNGIWLSDTAGQVARLNVNGGGSLSAASPVFIGHTGAGIMSVSGSGSRFTGSSTTFLGGNGTLSVTKNATYTLGGTLFLGGGGKGLLNITSGGNLTATRTVLGETNSGSGEVTVENGTLNAGTLSVGANGEGSLTASNNSTVNASELAYACVIGQSAAGNATFDSSTFNAGELYVGVAANGSLTMKNGSVLTTSGSNAFIASGNATGFLEISGEGSQWLYTGVVFIGNSGNGTLNVLDGAVVSSGGGHAFVGAGDNSNGTLLVDGKGSSYTVCGTDDFSIGGKNSSVTVSNGGFLETKGRAFIAPGSETSANATVTGPGSRWRSMDYFSIGQQGNASLTVAAGGVVQVGAGGNGTIYIGDQNANHALNIGAGAGAGTIEASEITGGFSGTSPGVLNFNHTDSNYFLTNTGNSNGNGIAITGNITVRLLGNGTTTLTANNTYTGGTAISAGTLRVNGSAGNITVENGATLGGNGTTLNVLVKSGGAIAPGNLSTGNLTLDGSSIWKIEISSVNGTVGTDWDLVNSVGSLTVNTTSVAPVTVTVSASGNLTGVKQATWILGNFPGGIVNFAPAAFTANVTGFTGATGTFAMGLGAGNTTLVLNYTTGLR